MQFLLCFDDISTPPDKFFSRQQIAVSLAASLKNHHVENSIFFSNSIWPEGEELQKLWNTYGTVGEIGNHTHRHLHYQQTEQETFFEDIAYTQNLLKQAGHCARFFRYPYFAMPLHHQQAEQMENYLSSLNLHSCPPTVDFADWYFELKLLEHFSDLDSIPKEQVVQKYCQLFFQAIESFSYYLEPNFPRVISLHANTINTLALPTLLKELKGNKAQFLNRDLLLDCFKDDHQYLLPEVTYTARKAHAQGTSIQDLQSIGQKRWQAEIDHLFESLIK